MKFIQILIIVFITICAIPSMSADWVPIAGTNKQIDKSRIRVDSAGITWVWTKSVLSDFELKQLEEVIRRHERTIDYKNYSFSIDNWGLDCKQQLYAIKSSVDYSEDGHVIQSSNNKNLRFDPVVPETRADKILNAVCNSFSK